QPAFFGLQLLEGGLVHLPHRAVGFPADGLGTFGRKVVGGDSVLATALPAPPASSPAILVALALLTILVAPALAIAAPALTALLSLLWHQATLPAGLRLLFLGRGGGAVVPPVGPTARFWPTPGFC